MIILAEVLFGPLDPKAAETAIRDATLPAGRYCLRPLQSTQGAAIEISLADGQTLALTYDPNSGLKDE